MIQKIRKFIDGLIEESAQQKTKEILREASRRPDPAEDIAQLAPLDEVYRAYATLIAETNKVKKLEADTRFLEKRVEILKKRADQARERMKGAQVIMLEAVKEAGARRDLPPLPQRYIEDRYNGDLDEIEYQNPVGFSSRK